MQRRTRDVETSGDGSLRFSRYGDERRLQSPVRCEADTSARRCTLAVWVMVAVRGTAVQGRRCRSRRPHESDPVVEGRRAIEGMWAACDEWSSVEIKSELHAVISRDSVIDGLA